MIGIRGIPFTHLRSFEAMARRGSMKDAAEELGIASGNLSKQLKELESFIGTELIRRSPRGEVTPAGLNLLVQLQSGFGIICAAVNRARAENGATASIGFKSRARRTSFKRPSF